MIHELTGRLAKLNDLRDVEFSGTPAMMAHDATLLVGDQTPGEQARNARNAIFLCAKAVLLTDLGPVRSRYLAVLSECMRGHYVATGYFDSLIDAVVALELSLEVELPVDQEAENLYLMGRVRLAQEAATGKAEYADRAVEVLRRSVGLSAMPLAAMTLSRALTCSFDHHQDLALVDEAVTVARTAAGQAVGTRYDLSCRTGLASALSAQWKGRGDIGALREAATVAWAVVRESDQGDPVFPGRVRILSGTVLNLSRTKYSAAQVVETIELNRRVLARMNKTAPSRGEQMALLAGLLSLRASRENDDDAFDEAVALYRAVVSEYGDQIPLVRSCQAGLTAMMRRTLSPEPEQPETSRPQVREQSDEPEETVTTVAVGMPCPRCRGHVPEPVLEHAVGFPADHESIMLLLDGRFNTTECPTCAAVIVGETTVLVWWAEEKRLACIHTDAELMATFEREQNATVTSHADSLELGRVIYGWLCDYVNPRLRQADAGLDELPLQEAVDLLSPTLLGFWRREFDAGNGPSARGDSPPEDDEAVWGAVVGDHVMRIAEMLACDGRIDELAAELRDRVPGVCLTRPVIEELDKRRAAGGRPTSPGRFAGNLLVELAYANVVLLAGLTDVPENRLADFVVGAFISPDEAMTPPIRQMLAPAVITPVMSATDLWKVTTALMVDDRLSYEDVTTLAHRYGHAKAFQARRRNQGFGRASADQRASAVQEFRDLIRKCWTDPEEETSDTDLGKIVGRAVRILIVSDEIDHAQSIIDWVLSDLVASTPDAAVAVYTECLSAFLDLHRTEPARALTDRALSTDWLASYLESAPGLLPVRFLIALARCMLELGSLDRIQDVLQHAARKATTAEKEGTASATAVLYAQRSIAHTRATLHRAAGHYGLSIILLEGLIAVDGSSLAYRLALAKSLLEAGLTRRGLAQLDDLIGDDRSVGTSFLVDALCERSMAHERLGCDDAAVRDLERAYELAELINPEVRASIDRGASLLKPVDTAFADLCAERVRVLAAQDDADPGARLSAIAVLIIRAVRHDDFDGGGRLLSRFEVLAGEDEESWPWQVLVAGARIAERDGDLEKCHRLARRAFGVVLAKLPVGEDAAYALGWLVDKDDFQRVLAQTSVRLYDRRMLTEWTLLSAYEASNGLEISARARNPLLSTTDLKDALEQRLAGATLPISIFFASDGDDETRIGLIYATGGSVSVRLLDERFARSEVLEAQENLRTTLAAANPADTGRLDDRLDAWRKFSARLGAAITPWLGEQVVFLAGSSLANLPLHLVPVGDDRTVIDVAPVSYSPNFGTLLRAPRESAPTGRAAVLAVSKSSDSARFRERLQQAREGLAASLAGLYPSVISKTGTGVTLRTAGDLLQSVDETVFLCHGTRAGSDGGNGICVSADGQLPPPVFPADDPSAQKFILSWPDIVELTAACRYITSIACSSGRTNVGQGGVRVGLEQALFAGRTELITSPLWDVDQQSALTWMSLFVASRARGLGIAEAAREAALEARDEFPHFYHWGAFTVTGSLPLTKETK